MKREALAWCLAVSAILAVLTSLPFLLAFERQGSDLRFTGSLLAVEDGNSYIAKMRRGAAGDWLFRSPYTAMPQAGAPAFLGYLLLGKLAAGPGTHEQLVALLHLTRVLAIFLVVLATYRFASRFIDEERWRRWATVLAVAGEGLGWMVLAAGRVDWLGSQPLELYSPETFGFLALLTFPHLLLARALLLLGLDAYLESGVRPRAAWLAGTWLTLLVLVQPISVAAAGAALGMHQGLVAVRCVLRKAPPVFAWRRLRPAVIALAVPLLLVVGYAALLRTDPFLQTWAAQNVLRSPHPVYYVLAYGLLLPWAVVGARRAWKGQDLAPLLLIGWVVALPILAYAPTVVQRRLPEGGWVALAVLAALGLGSVRLASATRWRLALGTIGLSLVGSVLLVAGASQAAAMGEAPVFRPAAQVAAFEWLDQNAGANAIVLAAYSTGNALPAWANAQVLVGHGPESAGLAGLLPRVEAFYRASGASTDARALLAEFGVTHVFVGPAERALGFDEAALPAGLSPVYDQGEYAIFLVARSTPAARAMTMDGRLAACGAGEARREC